LIASSGVAPLITSIRGARPAMMLTCSANVSLRPSAGHCDISAGKETMHAAKATIAGLNGFWPSPP
jgi:hypothetical protein